MNTGSSTFSTGRPGRGFFYGGGSNSLTGATNFRSTGNFTGTLVALTADQTTAGTVLGISAQNLTTGKAIDVSLGTLYAGTTDAVGGYTIGAVNVRAQSYTGNIFNVSASGAASSTGTLANLQSNQLAGQILNVTATSLTTGKADRRQPRCCRHGLLPEHERRLHREPDRARDERRRPPQGGPGRQHHARRHADGPWRVDHRTGQRRVLDRQRQRLGDEHRRHERDARSTSVAAVRSKRCSATRPWPAPWA